MPGYSVAAAWGAAVLLVGALLIAVLVSANPKPLAATGPSAHR